MTYQQLLDILSTLSKEQLNDHVAVCIDNDEVYGVHNYTITDCDDILHSNHFVLLIDTE